MSAYQEPMIYPQKSVADQIADRLTAVKGKKYAVVKIPQGFQVVPVTISDYVSPAQTVYPLKFDDTVIQVLPAKSSSAVTHADFVGEFPLISDSAKYITVSYNGKAVSFGKSTLLAWDKNPHNGMVTLRMSVAVAKKRGLIF